MAKPYQGTWAEPPTEELILLVAGASIRAEVYDRPMAYRLREAMLRWQDELAADELAEPLTPVVVTDLWYLNNDSLRARPTISIGEPESNAATAFLATRLPTALLVDGALRIQVDPEFIDLRACFWGTNPSAMSSAADAFVERYLDAFLRAAHNLPMAE